jgi:carboxymethylenebutenolidase
MANLGILTDPESVELIKAALATLAKHAAADPSKVVVAGYCQTGRHPLIFASEVPISAAVVWYGAASKREWEVNKLQPKPLDEVIAAVPCPVFAAFGEADHIISIEDVQRFRNALEAHPAGPHNSAFCPRYLPANSRPSA